MGHIRRITEEYYDDVRRSLQSKWRWTRFTKRHINDVAYKHGISFKTVMQIKNSATYEDYRAQCLAQHPEVQYSLAAEVLKLHEIVFSKGEEYHKPKTAQTAITQLIYKMENEK